MNILILAALDSEIRSLINSYAPAVIVQEKKYSLFNKKIDCGHLFFGISGVGAKNVKRFLKYYSSLNIKIDLLISTGFAGAINPDYKTGDIVIAKKITALNTGNYYEITASPYLEEINKSKSPKIHISNGSCSNQFVMESEKKELRAKYPMIDFVDMESFETVKFCQDSGMDLIILRSVSDGSNLRFPPLEFVQDSFQRINWKKFFLHVLKKPSVLYNFINLQFNLIIAKRSLYKELKNLVNYILGLS